MGQHASLYARTGGGWGSLQVTTLPRPPSWMGEGEGWKEKGKGKGRG